MAAETGGDVETRNFLRFADDGYDIRNRLDHAGPCFDDGRAGERREDQAEILLDACDDSRIRLVEAYARAQGLFETDGPDPEYTKSLPIRRRSTVSSFMSAGMNLKA